MQCPVCQNSSLVMSERSGIEIDYCNQCRGVWLDRGELDKIIERSLASAPTAANTHSRSYSPQQSPQAPHGYPPQQGYYKNKKHKSFLSEIFDFD
jgi:hypothetical protein